MTQRFDTLWRNANLATMTPGGDAVRRARRGALGARDGAIAWLGAERSWTTSPSAAPSASWIAPGSGSRRGSIDPHTHLVFGGDRVADFERRAGGESYLAAASGGSGIAHTVAMTRAAGEETLHRAAARRLRTMIANGTTTVEIKSGYGLDVETELRMLRVARRLGRELGITVRTTYLGAHVVPPEFATARDDYLALVCDEMLPRVAREGLADAVDVFCDEIAFTPAESARVLDAAQRARAAR